MLNTRCEWKLFLSAIFRTTILDNTIEIYLFPYLEIGAIQNSETKRIVFNSFK